MYDSRTLDPLRRFYAAEAVRQSRNVPEWPAIPGWNDRACMRHQQMGAGAPLTIESAVTLPRCICGGAGLPHVCPLCNRCGVILRNHQKVGGLWLYLAGKGLLADKVGMGKTFQVGTVLALGRANGELGVHARTVIACKPAAMGQWKDELLRILPGLHIIVADSDLRPPKRRELYLRSWEVCIISPQTLSPARGSKTSRSGDLEHLSHFPLGMVVYDDTDAMRHRSNRQAWAITRLAENVPRVIGVHGTSLQKRLPELYSFLVPLGGPAVFGTEGQFKRRFVSQETSYYWVTEVEENEAGQRIGRRVRKERRQDGGIKNAEELRTLLAPLVIRRGPEDTGGDMTIPRVVPSVVWLDPLPAQARAYEEIRQGVLRKLNEAGDTIDIVTAKAMWMQGWQVCSGLATQGHDASVKLDWVCDALTGDLDGDKAVVFVNFKPNVEALSRRLTELGVGNVVLWGAETNRQVRDARLAAFRDDPACRVIIGTTTIEASVNLQSARHVIAVDTIANPARMTQIIGRAARAGSAYTSVYFHQLLLRGTQEEYIPAQLADEQGMADEVWGEQSDLFTRVSPGDIARMITQRRAA